MPPVVLDASALLAYWLDESGAGVVEQAIGEHGALISAANFAEVLTKLTDARVDFADTLSGVEPHDAEAARAIVASLPLAGGAISVEPFELQDALLCAKLRPLTLHKGLSLGDRACLALALRVGVAALTADQAWTDLTVGVSVIQIRM